MLVQNYDDDDDDDDDYYYYYYYYSFIRYAEAALEHNTKYI